MAGGRAHSEGGLLISDDWMAAWNSYKKASLPPFAISASEHVGHAVRSGKSTVSVNEKLPILKYQPEIHTSCERRGATEGVEADGRARASRVPAANVGSEPKEEDSDMLSRDTASGDAAIGASGSVSRSVTGEEYRGSMTARSVSK